MQDRWPQIRNNMGNYLKIISILIFGLSACNRVTDAEKMENWKAEIMAVEKEFNDMAQKEGLIKAFEFYAAEDRGNPKKKRSY